MKLLHTGDWHLGKSLRAQPRREEYEAVLAELLDIARRESVDCLLVAGDVFDSTTPPPEAEELLFGFLRELFGLGIPAVIIGGNHDHPRRLAAVSKVLEVLNVHMRPEAVTRFQLAAAAHQEADSRPVHIASLEFSDDLTAIHHCNSIGHDQHLVQIFGYQEERVALIAVFHQVAADFFSCPDIQPLSWVNSDQ